jgi:hypothetical protein
MSRVEDAAESRAGSAAKNLPSTPLGHCYILLLLNLSPKEKGRLATGRKSSLKVQTNASICQKTA